MSSAAYQTDSVELQNCAREAIHQIQTVQPHGFLLACNAATGLITALSENTFDYMHTGHTDLLGRSVFELLEGEPDSILAQLASVLPGTPMLIELRFRSSVTLYEHFEVVAHCTESTVVIEAMPFKQKALVSATERRQIEDLVNGVGELQQQKSLEAFLNACVTRIRQMSGYQRVFIYRFLPDWSGEVIAESTAVDCSTRFLGLRFPASDIPEQARALYCINLLRIVGDVDATAVPLLVPPGGAPLNQSHSLLRSPSPMHLRYLQNMGVKATMTISLLKDGKLWGLASCHHNLPRKPPAELRRMTMLLCALLAEVAVVRLEAILYQDMLNKTLRLREALSLLMRKLGSAEDFPLVVERALADLGTVMNIGTCCLMLAGRWTCAQSIEEDLLSFLVRRGCELPPDTAFVSHCLRDEPGLAAAQAGDWAGAMVLSIPGIADSFLVLLRREVVQEVKWAGAPVKEHIELVSGLHVLGPRKSFESWSQLMRGQSEPWTAHERIIAQDVAATLGNAQQAYSRQVMQTELRMLGSCMEHLNDMVIVTDTESANAPGPRIIFVNQAFINQTGYTREEVIGRSPRFLQGPATDRDQVAVIRRAILYWSSVTVELINYRKNGEPFWVELSLTPIADHAGWFTHWVAIERNIDDRKRSEATMQHLVNFDPLTSLANRRLLMDRLPAALSMSKRYSHDGALMFIDLDNFKDLNDTEGHQVGDELLKQVAKRLVSIVRLEDTVARLGGDEFVVMLENLGSDATLSVATAQNIAEKIIVQLARPYDLQGHSYSTTASLGISMFQDGELQHSMEELFKQADFAMYQSKSAGRNTWCFFDPKMQAALVERNALEADLQQAFAKNMLTLHYQPIVDVSGSIVGVEALMRWSHPTRGWVSPLEFIPLAEHSGLIVPIGEWAIGQACVMLQSWAGDSLRGAWSVAVNVSARQIRQPDFVAVVEKLIIESGCDPALLTLELTESLLQYDFSATIAKMQALRDIGVAFSIDDFGTGYSSLAYLQRLPIVVLKIDSSFVRDIGEDSNDRSICMMILALGKTLGLSIVAEGVETIKQYDFLKLHHCDKFQGHLFSEAVPAELLANVAADLTG